MDCILYPKQCELILKFSFLSLGTSMYAVYNGRYDFAMCSGGVFLTSINYWKNPTYSWRRNLDILYVNFVLMYQIYHAYESKYMMEYYVLMFSAISFYPIGHYYYAKKRYWISTYAHCALHFFANLGNLVLYSI
uniref:Uncharacterized protein n=1 Tax=viral metagenome TaxID=1070528 RepID=A0A6C0E706_9ZZZZ